MNNAARDCIQEAAEKSLVVSRQSILVLAVVRKLAPELNRVVPTYQRNVTGKVVLVREIVVRPELRQGTKSVTGDDRNNVFRIWISERRRDW